MNPACLNRLFVIGQSPVDFAGKIKSQLKGRFWELLEASAYRKGWQFETDHPPIEQLMQQSKDWPSLTFLLDYEQLRTKGMLTTRKGKVTRCHIDY